MSEEKQQFDSVEDMLMAVEPEMAVEFLKHQNADLKRELAELKAKHINLNHRINAFREGMKVYNADSRLITVFNQIFGTETEVKDGN